eukprot:6207781-Pleurochrysis_carterae.AAC.1
MSSWYCRGRRQPRPHHPSRGGVRDGVGTQRKLPRDLRRATMFVFLGGTYARHKYAQGWNLRAPTQCRRRGNSIDLQNLITEQPLQGRAGSSRSLGPTLSTTHAWAGVLSKSDSLRGIATRASVQASESRQ